MAALRPVPAALLALLAAVPVGPARADAPSLAGAGQLLLVVGDGWDSSHGRLQRLARPGPGRPFQPVGAALPVWLGRSGLALPPSPPPPAGLPVKHEGDGRSPAMLLPVGELWGYAAAPPPGVRLPYHAATARSRCVDDVRSPLYNRITEAPAGPEPWASAEALRLPTDHYKYLVVLGYNRDPVRPGDGSCIFLHVAPPPGGPTAGCTALAEADLLTVLRWLDPREKPLLLQLPRALGAAQARALGLPEQLFQ